MRSVCSKYLMIGLCLLSLSPFIKMPICKAEVVWSEDFDDGDIDGWTIVQGNFSVEDGTLRSIVEEFHYAERWFLSVMYHPSTIAVGTWSFDFMFDSPSESPVIVVDFMSQTQHQYLGTSRGNNYGFYVGNEYPAQVVLYQDAHFQGPGGSFVERHTTFSGTERQKWHHIDITRDEEGRLRVYIDGDLGIDVVDKAYSESSFLGVMLEHSRRGDAVIDNIVVSDTIDVEPSQSEEGSRGIPGFPFESVIIAIVVGVFIFWRMQQRK